MAFGACPKGQMTGTGGPAWPVRAGRVMESEPEHWGHRTAEDLPGCAVQAKLARIP